MECNLTSIWPSFDPVKLCSSALLASTGSLDVDSDPSGLPDSTSSSSSSSWSLSSLFCSSSSSSSDSSELNISNVVVIYIWDGRAALLPAGNSLSLTSWRTSTEDGLPTSAVGLGLVVDCRLRRRVSSSVSSISCSRMDRDISSATSSFSCASVLMIIVTLSPSALTQSSVSDAPVEADAEAEAEAETEASGETSLDSSEMDFSESQDLMDSSCSGWKWIDLN